MRGLLFTALFFACSCSEKKMHCAAFKKGKFYCKIASLGTIYSITRNDSIQTEIDIVTGSVTTSRITWVNDCVYELRFVSKTMEDSVTNEEQRKLRLHLRTLPTIVNIKTVNADYYICDARKEGYPTYGPDTIWIAKPY